MDNSIFVDVYDVMKDGAVFNWLYGARGKGKTYSALRHSIVDGKKILYLRTKQKEFDIAVSEEGNPYKKLNSDNGWTIHFKGGDIKNIVDDDGRHYGYAAALTTFGNLYGADWSDVDVIIWDEFIQKKGENRISGIAALFFGMYESVCRNREMQGLEAVKVIGLSNANSIYCELFSELGLIPELEKMTIDNKFKYVDLSRGLAVYRLQKGEFERKKAKTALYKLITTESPYYKMAIDNDFAFDSWFGVKKRPIQEYRPICAIENAYIYRHKSDSHYYVSRKKSNCPTFNMKDTHAYFLRTYGIRLREPAVSGKMFFEDMEMKYVIGTALKL